MICRFAVKPTSSILTERRSIDADMNEESARLKALEMRERAIRQCLTVRSDAEQALARSALTVRQGSGRWWLLSGGSIGIAFAVARLKPAALVPKTPGVATFTRSMIGP